ncbi:MAG TPA: GH3 auxin-responsive promoter family protein [Polyangiaceae bacterium]|nr:GH3 auxin-responsive promoter family protein [Polyangiaceae bacterium]
MMQSEPIHAARPSHPEAGAPAQHDSAAPLQTSAPASRTLVKSGYPALAGKAVLEVAKAQTRRWDLALTRVRHEQERVLLDIVRHAKNTSFGVARDFAGIRDYRDFAASVPIGDYDSFSPFIERMRRGEKNLLVPEFVRYYGNSSGTSTNGRSKFLPITERQVALQRKAGTDGLFRTLAMLSDDTFPAGFTIGLFPPTTMKVEGPVLITSNPALMSARMPLFTKPNYLPDEECKRMADYDAKLARIAEKYIDYDVRALAGTTCWFTLMFEKLLAEARRRGRSERTVSQIWPNLRMLLGGGVSADPYLPVIRDMMGRSDVLLVDTYNATEGGIYASSDHSGEPGMLMQPHRGTFFEFVPLEENDSPNPTRVPLWEVELGKPYVILVTTVSGLYAYKLGDIVRFPRRNRMEYVGRLSGCLSVTQELTTHVEVEKAVASAIGRVPCTTVDFGVSAEIGAKSRYMLFVEFVPGKGPADRDAFARAFDEGMCEQNRVYREHRKGDVAILAPHVVVLQEGGARRYLDQVTRGNMQGKFPRIIDPSRKAQVLAFAESGAFS